MTTLALIVLAAFGVAAVFEMSAEAIKRRINTAFYEGFALGRDAGLDEAGRRFNADVVRWRG